MAAARIKTVAMVLIRPDKEGEKVTMLEKDINPKPEAIKKINFYPLFYDYKKKVTIKTSLSHSKI